MISRCLSDMASSKWSVDFSSDKFDDSMILLTRIFGKAEKLFFHSFYKMKNYLCFDFGSEVGASCFMINIFISFKFRANVVQILLEI